MAALARRVQLPNTAGLSMPQIQLGLYLTSGKETEQAVIWALQAGYRGFDSAQMYHNEQVAGRGIKQFLASSDNTQGLTRDDIHYTSKLAANGSYNEVRRSIKASVDACGLGYIDLFLLHSPYGGKKQRLESWRAVEDAVQEGQVRIGGVSNFGVKHVQELVLSNPRTLPAVNQIEVHPFNTRTGIRDICTEHNIVVEAYAPLARALRMKHPTVAALSNKYGCTPAQLMVRWSIQHDLVPLPKSVKQQRILENAEIDGFDISQEDMLAMDALDEYLVTDWDPVNCP